MEKNRKLLLETLLQLSPFPPRVGAYLHVTDDYLFAAIAFRLL